MRSEFLEKDKIVFTKDDLKDGDVVTLRNGCKLVFCNGFFEEVLGNEDNTDLDGAFDLTDDLRYDSDCLYTDEETDNDIMKVERPTQYKIMYERKEEVKEMTLAQVCEELGYNVKIIKEE